MIEYYKNRSLKDLFYINDEGLVCCEEWRDVVGYEGYYQVSNLGRIKGLERIVICNKKGNTKKLKEKMMSQSCTKDYLSINLRMNGKVSFFTVHRLIAIAFIPNPENKPEVNHIKGNKYDNRIWMLEWSTKSENGKHAFQLGLSVSKKGSDCVNSKLTEQQVLEIRELGKSLNFKQISIIYKVSPSSISNIVKRKSWTHI